MSLECIFFFQNKNAFARPKKKETSVFTLPSYTHEISAKQVAMLNVFFVHFVTLETLPRGPENVK